MDDHFEIGVWLIPADVRRAVEQICHIETYLRNRRRQDGQLINDERVIDKWVNKYAAAFSPLSGG